MKWILWFLLFSGLSIVIALPFVCNSLTSSRLHVLTDRENKIRGIFPKFIADLKALERSSPFSTRSRQRNAEPLLSRFVSFQGNLFEPIATPSHVNLRKLYDKFPRNVHKQEEFDQFAADPLIAEIDTGWMDDLYNFDHWKPSTHPIIQAEIAKAKDMNSLGRIGLFSNLPQPDTNELRHWGMVYFVQSYKRGEVKKGFAMFRKLAELTNSSDGLIGAMTAVSFLKYESKLVQFTHETEWKTVAPETVEALLRTGWGWTGVLNASWLSGFPAELEPLLKANLGMCTAAGESANGFIALSDFLEPRFPLELDFSKPIADARRIRSILEKECEVVEFKFVSDRSPASANPLFNHDLSAFSDSNPAEKPALPNPARIPYVRRLVGTTILTIAMPNFMKYYTEEAH